MPLALAQIREGRLNLFEFAMQGRRDSEACPVPRRIERNENLVHVIQKFTGANHQLIGQRTELAGLRKLACFGKDFGANVRFARQFGRCVADGPGAGRSDRLHRQEVHADMAIVAAGR